MENGYFNLYDEYCLHIIIYMGKPSICNSGINIRSFKFNISIYFEIILIVFLLFFNENVGI